MHAPIEVAPCSVPADDLSALAEFASSLEESQLRDLLLGLSEILQDGGVATLLGGDKYYTPSQVASRLGMSRAHLYKLLDSGQIPSHRVGRDRRIKGGDIVLFEKQRQAERRELAERFANAAAIRESAVDELVDEL